MGIRAFALVVGALVVVQPTASLSLCRSVIDDLPPHPLRVPPSNLQHRIAFYCALAREGDVSAHRSLARLYSDEGSPAFDLQAAAGHYRRAIELGHVESYYALAFILRDLGEGEAALAAFEKAAQAGREAAKLQIANGHLRGWFGDASRPEVGFSILKGLAAAGDQEAQLDLAEAFAKAAEPDFAAAVDLYRSAADPDRPSAYLGLGRALLALGDGEGARAALEAALRYGDPRAEFELARGHYQRSFSAASLPEEGRRMLIEMAEQGHLGAIRTVVRMPPGSVSWDFQRIEKHLLALSEAKNPWAIEALILLYRTHPGFAANSISARKELLEVKGSLIREQTLGRELIQLMMDPRSQIPDFDTLMKVLDELQMEGYEAALRELSKLNRNYYVRVIQRELGALGFFKGRIDGLMGPRTVSAICGFSKEAGVHEVCWHGPLTSASLNAMTAALASFRRSTAAGPRS